MKKQTNFRLSEQALTNLAHLMGTWKCSRTEAVERALTVALQTVDCAVTKSFPAGFERPDGPNIVHVDVEPESETGLAYAGERLRKNAKHLRPSGIDRDKIAAAQSWLVKGKK